MNCSEAKNISIREVLDSFSLSPSKDNSRTAFYFALDRKEKIPSLSVDFIRNTAFDFGTGKKYDVISIVQALKKCSTSEALKYLEQFTIPYQNQTNTSNPYLENGPKPYEIIDVKEIQHPALLEYLKRRRVEDQKHLAVEIHYQVNDKKYFGIGFKNDSDGYEIRNPYSKICLGKKDITTIKNGSESLRIFEGFFDFLSFKNVEKLLEKEISDYIILNSTSMIYKIKDLRENYRNIQLYLDNDEAGNRAAEMIENDNEMVEDCRNMYSDFKDVNEWLVASEKVEEKLGTSLVQKVPKVYNKRSR